MAGHSMSINCHLMDSILINVKYKTKIYKYEFSACGKPETSFEEILITLSVISVCTLFSCFKLNLKNKELFLEMSFNA